jgi:cytochrome oxidase Cu insertion factor (SCO1/SenC/PrrC family)
VKQWGVRRRLWSGLALVSLGLAFAGVSISWGAQPAAPPDGLSALNTPALMPSFNLPGVDGTRVDSAALQGKVVVVRFWATW